MTIWDLATWVAVGVLGPGALLILAAFLRDLRKLLGRGSDREASGSEGA